MAAKPTDGNMSDAEMNNEDMSDGDEQFIDKEMYCPG